MSEQRRCEALLDVVDQELKETLSNDFGVRTAVGLVFKRLLALVRVSWVKLMDLEAGTAQAVTALVRGWPDDVQVTVITKFDRENAQPGASLLTRLRSFAQGLMSSKSPRCSSADRLNRGASTPNSARPAPSRESLVEAAMNFLDSLPEGVRHTVISNFAHRDDSPSRATVMAADHAFGKTLPARAAWVKRLRLDRTAIGLLQSLPEEVQRVVVRDFEAADFPGVSTSDGLKSFAEAVMARFISNNRVASPGSCGAYRASKSKRVPSRPAVASAAWSGAGPVLGARKVVRDPRGIPLKDWEERKVMADGEAEGGSFEQEAEDMQPPKLKRAPFPLRQPVPALEVSAASLPRATPCPPGLTSRSASTGRLGCRTRHSSPDSRRSSGRALQLRLSSRGG